MGCLDNIVGLSRTDCECFEDDRPENWDTSESGLFIDELPGLAQKNVETSKDCGEGSIWDIMSRARENAIKRFRTDLLTGLSKRFKNRFPPFEGIIGKKDFNGASPQLDNIMGVTIESNCIKGSCMTLKGIDAFFDQTGQFEVNIYRTDSDDVFAGPFTLDAEANKKKSNVLPSPVEMPLYVDGLGDFKYHIVYTLPAGWKPCNNKIGCACNMKKNRPWALWIDVGGLRTDSFSTSAELYDLPMTTYTYGLNLVAQIECKKGTIICEEGHVWDFENDDISLQMAYAIQEMSGVMLVNEILARPDSAFFALNEEQLSQLGAQFAANYQGRIEYLALNIDPTNDCFVCNNQVRGVGIMS